MKKTIKEDNARNIIREEYLDDNTLLQVVGEKGNVSVCVRYVDSPISGIKETTLLVMRADEFIRHMDKIITINETRDTIAIFTPTKEGYRLRDVYDAKEHSFEASDFIDLLYNQRFKQKELAKSLF